MLDSEFYLVAIYSLIISCIEDLLKLDDPEMRKAIEKFGKEIQELIK